ncbi:hypothetical protein B4923_11360 [Brenneria roseae subsp. americana]|uniref:Uncharacterized protein n=1 Tax=Brenneria roseae subsp. americana TaxID=1508507 RepID=A0A2U1TR78_9GAMM|nr:hypothetical protein [Brenneria roseae]PWC11906.1 hypothetical protein B4923_11360 [Brenneria roseae subsp. americana]
MRKIIGCDDTPLAAWEGYRLTTARQPVEQLVEQVLINLALVLTDTASGGVIVRVKPMLVIR